MIYGGLFMKWGRLAVILAIVSCVSGVNYAFAATSESEQAYKDILTKQHFLLPLEI